MPSHGRWKEWEGSLASDREEQGSLQGHFWAQTEDV